MNFTMSAEDADDTVGENPDDVVPDVYTMSVKELKAAVTSVGLPLADCSDKGELRARALEALACSAVELSCRVEFAAGDDPCAYSPTISQPVRRLLLKMKSYQDCEGAVNNWSDIYDGYYEWGIPEDKEYDGMQAMMHHMQTQFMYGPNGGRDLPSPKAQLGRLLSLRKQRQFDLRAASSEPPMQPHLAEQIFIVKVVLAPYHTAAETGDWSQRTWAANGRNTPVWRRIAVHGGTRLDNLHDKVRKHALHGKVSGLFSRGPQSGE